MNIRRGAAVLGTAVAVIGGVAGAAQASPSGTTCSGGDIASGTYQSLAVTGDCTVPAHADVTVLGDVTVAPGAGLDAQSAPSTVMIGGAVRAGAGSLLGLGCTAAHGGCEDNAFVQGPYAGEHSTVSVGGSIVLSRVYDAALNGIEVWGNVTSTGGGAGLVFDGGTGSFVPFSVKDDVIHGNLVVEGLTTTWFGLIRSTVDGNVLLKGITNDDPDGMEVVHDTIGRNIICQDNEPTPQFGDAVELPGVPASYRYSTVGGNALGQCAFVVEGG